MKRELQTIKVKRHRLTRIALIFLFTTLTPAHGMSGLQRCVQFLGQLLGIGAGELPVTSFMWIEKEGGTPLAIPRPGVLVASGNDEATLVTLDHNDVFADLAKGKLNLRIPFSGKAAAIATHGAEDGSLIGLPIEDAIALLKWLKANGFETVAILSCNQMVKDAHGYPFRSMAFHRLVSRMYKYDPRTFPRVVIAEPQAIGPLAHVVSSHDGKVAVGWEHPKGELQDVEDGKTYTEVSFSQQIWPPKR